MAFAFLFLLLVNEIFISKDAEADRLIRAAMRANYELDLNESQRFARILQDRYPGHPVGISWLRRPFGGERNPIQRMKN